MMNNISKTIGQIGIILTILGTLMFVGDVGINETWNVIADNPTRATTDAVFGCTTDSLTGLEVCPGADLVDRVVVTAMTVGLLVGLGIIGISSKNPAAVNNLIRYLPLLGLAIGLTQFSSEVMDVINGDHVFEQSSDAYNGMLLAITGWVASGVTRFFK